MSLLPPEARVQSRPVCDAVRLRATVEYASQTIRNIQSVWVKEFEGVVENNQVTQFQVIVKLSFLVGEGMDMGADVSRDVDADFVTGRVAGP